MFSRRPEIASLPVGMVTPYRGKRWTRRS